MDVTKYLSRMILAIRELPPPHIDGGTEPGTGENPDDTWTEVTSLAGLEGTWESQYTLVEDSNGKIVSKTVVDVFTYPATGKNNVGGESEIEEIPNGVKLESFIIENGERKVLYPCSYMKVDEFLKNYRPEGMWLVNKFKTAVKVKTETCVDADGNLPGYPEPIKTSSDWKKFQDMMEQYMPSGDQSVTFSEKEPYTVTTTYIYHKTSESTNPGENPDSGTNPGTEPGTGENPDDTWTKITSFDGLEGTWLAKGIGTEKDSTTGELRSSPLYVSITYPFSGGNGVEIKDDVRVRMIDGLAVEDYIMVPDDFFNFVQTPGVIPFPLSEERESSNVKVNQSKTELKTEVVIIAPETITTKEDWEKINQEGPSLSGDMFLSFVEGSPCTITGTVIFHKVDANTNIGTEPGTGENPDDTWTKITSFDGLDGTWKASYITKVPSGNFETVESVPVELLMAYPYWGTGEEGQEIVNGVGFGIFLNGVGQPTRILSKDELESILKTGTNGGVATELYINSTRTELKEVRTKILNSEPSNGSPIKDDTEWEQCKLQQAPYLPEGDMKITFSTSTGSDGKKTYKETSTQILHKQ